MAAPNKRPLAPAAVRVPVPDMLRAADRLFADLERGAHPSAALAIKLMRRNIARVLSDPRGEG